MSGKNKNEELVLMIRRGIGTRSISQFAKDCGLSREYVSRILNGQVEKPSKKSLKKMADACESISYNGLLSCCGYDTVDPKKTAEEIKRLFSEGFNAFSGITQWASLQEFCDTIRMLYSPSDGTFKIRKPCSLSASSGAKSSCEVYFRTEDGDYAVYTYFEIDYTDADGCVYVHKAYFPEGVLPKGADSSYDPDLSCCIYKRSKGKEDRSVEEHLLRAIFGEGGGKKMYESFEGIGFYTDKAGDPFEYIASNREYLCRNEETAKMYRDMLRPDGSAQEAFKDFKSSGRYDRTGVLGAVAEILTNKTGVEFGTLASDDGPYGHEECIMNEYISETKRPHNLPDSVIYSIYEAAKALGIESFGNVSITFTAPQSSKYSFKTDEYYIPF